MKTTKSSLIALVLFALFTSPIVSSPASAAPKVGEAAPDFKLPDPDGKEVSLSDYKGKFVVLEWVNHGCPFVKKHYDSRNMQTLQKTYTDKGVVWLTICSSAPGKQGHMTPAQAKQSLVEKNASPTALLLDPEGTVGRLYNAEVTPEMFIIDPEGKLVYAGAIDDKKSTDPADIKESKNYVSAALDALLAGKPVGKPVTKAYGCTVKY